MIHVETELYKRIAMAVANLVAEKQEAYGDSFGRSKHLISVLYPDGIRSDQYDDALAIIRVIDKLFRIANKKDAFREDPWKDIMGYAMLGVAKNRKKASK
jgi:hypothetical protein